MGQVGPAERGGQSYRGDYEVSKKSGILGALAKAGLVEGDVPAVPQEDAPAPAVAPPVMSAPTFPAVGLATPVLGPEDQARVKALEAQVYATPSSYVIFQSVRESLGSPTDMLSVFPDLWRSRHWAIYSPMTRNYIPDSAWNMTRGRSLSHVCRNRPSKHRGHPNCFGARIG